MVRSTIVDARVGDVILYDQFGTGQNPGSLPAGYAIADMADEVIGILDDAGIALCHVMGHAPGGLVGLHLARHHPRRLTSLIVVNGWASLDPHTARCFAVRTALLTHGGPAAGVKPSFSSDRSLALSAAPRRERETSCE